MNFNINDEQFQEKERKAIFNDGKAGFVRNCSAKVTKRGADDNQGGPKYKIFFTDPETGAEVNRAYFVLRADASVGSQNFFGKDMKHIMKQCGHTPTKSEFGAEELLDYVMSNCKAAFEANKWAVGVSYGNKKKPNTFLEVDGYWGFKNEALLAVDTKLQLSDNAILTRIDPSNITIGQPGGEEKVGEDTDDLPF